MMFASSTIRRVSAAAAATTGSSRSSLAGKVWNGATTPSGANAASGCAPRWFASVPTDSTTESPPPTDPPATEAPPPAEEPAPTMTAPIKKATEDELKKNLKPSEIVSSLDLHIVGQQDAKKAVAIAMRNRWRRRQLPEDLRKEVTPRNVLLVGPTGTYLCS